MDGNCRIGIEGLSSQKPITCSFDQFVNCRRSFGNLFVCLFVFVFWLLLKLKFTLILKLSWSTFYPKKSLFRHIIRYITQWHTVCRKSMDYTSLCDEADDILLFNCVNVIIVSASHSIISIQLTLVWLK